MPATVRAIGILLEMMVSFLTDCFEGRSSEEPAAVSCFWGHAALTEVNKWSTRYDPEKVPGRFMKNPAFRFVLVLGIVNLFADMTYEGGGSINGQFLGSLGASAASVAIIAGVGEFLGYSLRSFSGWIADRLGKPWLTAFVGYSINLLAVPAMVFAGTWQTAAALICLERIGRAVRKPTTEAMLSYTTAKFGRGWVYGFNTALDETGATLGPLLMALLLMNNKGYKFGYSLLLIPSCLALFFLIVARIRFPVPKHFEEAKDHPTQREFSRAYWIYMIAGACFAAGLMSYELVSFHLLKTNLISEAWIPGALALATASGIAASLILGRAYDRRGLPVIIAAIIFASLFTPMIFLGGPIAAILAMPCLGIGYATQDTLLKAIVAGLLPKGRRHFAFGLFYTGYGGGWLIGSIACGLLYEYSKAGLVTYAVLAQVLSIPLMIFAARTHN